MIYTDNCCFCIDLRCGCILIAIVDVLLRGFDHFIVDRKYRMRILCYPKVKHIFFIGTSALGYISVSITGLYVICCIVLLIAVILVILSIRYINRVQFLIVLFTVHTHYAVALHICSNCTCHCPNLGRCIRSIIRDFL